jgi:hypothetical protein
MNIWMDEIWMDVWMDEGGNSLKDHDALYYRVRRTERLTD